MQIHIEEHARRSLLAKKIADGGYTVPARRQPSLINNHTIEGVKRILIQALNAGHPDRVLRALVAFKKQYGANRDCFRMIERTAREHLAHKH